MGPTNKQLALAKHEEAIPPNGEAREAEIVAASITPILVLREAMQRGATVEVLEKLLGVQERFEANEARKAFARDLAAFKAEAPRLEKVREVDFTSRTGNRVHFKYAPLDYVCDTLRPVLSRHNFSHTWDVDQTNPEKVRVTCLLEHALGHIKRVSLESALIDDQRMNVLQRLRATVSMLQRYTLESATGMASADVDGEFEGQESGKPVVAADKIEELCRQMSEVETLQDLQTVFKKAYGEAQGMNDRQAMAHYIKAKDARKKELEHAPR